MKIAPTMSRIMALKLGLATLAMFCTASMEAQYKWTVIKMNEERSHMNAVTVSNDGTYAVAVGANRAVLESSDGGTTWQNRTIGDRIGELLSVAFYSGQGVVAVGDDGEVYRREVHGGSWTKQVITSETTLRAVEYVSDNILLIGTAHGEIYRSADAGLTWTKVASSLQGIRSIAASKAGICMCVGESGSVHISTDKGLIWSTTPTQAPVNILLKRVAHVRDSVWMIAGDTSYLARSTDNGTTWKRSKLDTNVSSKYTVISALAFATPDRGVMIGADYVKPGASIYCTSDGGATWYSGYDLLGAPPSLLIVVSDLKFAPNNLRGIASGASTRISTIRIIPDSLPFIYERREIVPFLGIGSEEHPLFLIPTTENSLISVSAQWRTLTNGFKERRPNVVEERTQDGALIRLWKADDGYGQAFGISYKSVAYLNNNSIIVVADSNYDTGSQRISNTLLMRTIDGGATWRRITPNTTGRMYNLFCKSDSEYMIQQGGAIFYQTTDGGTTWSQSGLPAGYKNINLELVTTSSYMAVGTKEDNTTNLLRYTDNNQWEVVLENLPTGRRLFVHKGPMFIFGTDKVYHIVVTQDETSATLTEVGDIKVQLATGSLIASYRGRVFEIYGGTSYRESYNIRESTDSGRTFQLIQPDKTLQYLKKNSAYLSPLSLFTLGSRLYVAMTDGTVMYTNLNDTLTSVTEITVDVTGDIYTNPPYPNPFSTTTTIRVAWLFTVLPAQLTLNVYSSTGEEIADLTSELRFNAQDYSSVILFDGSALPAGVYYVQCKGGGYSSTQQMIVVR